jgi:hypothetical protein
MTRGPFLTTMAALFGLLAVSNATKALQHLRNPEVLGLVILGVRFESTFANALLGPLMGLVLAAYGFGLWRQRRWVIPIAVVYAFYVPTNLVLFWYRQTGPDVPPLGFILVYLVFALGGSIGTALYLAFHPERLDRPRAVQRGVQAS